MSSTKSPNRSHCWTVAAPRASATLLVFAFALALPLAAEPPDGTTLDGNTGGFDLDTSAADIVTSAAVGPDGKTVVAGYASDGVGVWRLVIRRWLANGLPDTGFGAGGGVVDPIGFGGSCYARAVAVLDDGRILVAGTCEMGGGDSDFVVLRLTQGGLLDTTFNGVGFRFVAFDVGDDLTDEAAAMAIDRSGRIVVAGSADFAPGDRDFAVARLHADGNLDTSFGINGLRTIGFDPSGADLDLGRSVAVDGSGRIVVAGSTRYQPVGGSPSFNLAVTRLLADGSMDLGFANNARWIAAFDLGGSLADHLWSVATTDDDRIVAAGEVATGASGESQFLVLRLLSSGTLDPGFAGTGSRSGTFCEPPATCPPGREVAHSVVVQGNGPVVIAGAGVNAAGNADFGVARLRADGTFDSAFGSAGRRLFDWDHGDGGDADDARTVVLGPDGRLTVAGTIESDFPDQDWGWARLANHLVFADGFDRGDLSDW